MFVVETYAAVRRFVFLEGHSRREAAQVFGLSRDTVAKMCRYSAPPGYVRSRPPEKPKLGALVPVIDKILDEDREGPAKQQHTAKRIFERLRDGNYPPPRRRWDQAASVAMMVLKGLAPGARRAVSITVRTSASPWAAHMAR